jgi:hypothetical protein
MAMVAWLAWHLNSKFTGIKLDLLHLLKDHEVQDQTRHLENLERFTNLAVGQARLGLLNGYHRPHGEEENIREGEA